MMTYDTDGTVVVVDRVLMVMEYDHERRQEKKQYQKSDKAMVTLLNVTFSHEWRLILTNAFVKR